MSNIILKVDLFRDQEDFKRSRDALLHVLEALTRMDEDYLRAFPATPQLYATGVVYRRVGPKEWFDVPTTIAEGWGDCKDFACYRAAELRNAGESQARPWLKHVMEPTEDGKTRYSFHVVVARRAQGRVWLEDPSRVLGMGINLPTNSELDMMSGNGGIAGRTQPNGAARKPLQLIRTGDDRKRG